MVVRRSPAFYAFSAALGMALSSLAGFSESALAQISVPVPQQALPGETTPEFCLVSPRDDAAIFSTRPVFSWKGGTVQRIELRDLTENELAWSGNLDLPVPQLAYRMTPLVPGHRYQWKAFGSSRQVVGTAEFEIMGEEERASIETALNTLRTQLTQQGTSPAQINVEVVTYLASMGLEADAITAAVNATPSAPALGRYIRTVRERSCNS
ncbi:MAG TPA: hypothetical protein V6D07_01180 [Trichocoleus sp.]